MLAWFGNYAAFRGIMCGAISAAIGKEGDVPEDLAARRDFTLDLHRVSGSVFRCRAVPRPASSHLMQQTNTIPLLTTRKVQRNDVGAKLPRILSKFAFMQATALSCETFQRAAKF